MAEDLQGLLERINQEGIKKTQAEKDRILAEAKEQADRIVKEAKAESERLIAEAREEGAKLQRAGEDKLKQAARDVVISLESQLKAQLTALVKACVGEALTPALVADLVLALSEAYGSRKGQVTSVDVLVPQARLDEFEAALTGKLGERFREGLRIAPVKGIDAGIQVSFDGESVFHDFTDDAITEMLCAYANPRIVAILRDKE